MLTDLELRQAIVALDVIDQQGHSDVMAAVVREAIESTPSAALWGNAAPGQQIAGGLLASHLAGLLGVSRERCEQAAAAVFAPQRDRAVFDALVGYAAELTGNRPRRGSATTDAAPPRSSVRIVADSQREGTP